MGGADEPEVRVGVVEEEELDKVSVGLKVLCPNGGTIGDKILVSPPRPKGSSLVLEPSASLLPPLLEDG